MQPIDNNNKTPKQGGTSTNDTHLKEVNREIYKRNLELAVVNKTLSLLRKLYQISLLALGPASLSEKMSEPVRADLNMETVGVLAFNEQTDSLVPFRFSKSQRLLEVINKLGFLFHDFKINEISKRPTLTRVLLNKTPALNCSLSDIWGGIIGAEKLNALAQNSHIKTVLLYPLVTQNKTIGALVMGLNRDYETLSDFEKESIKNCVDVIAIALDKALIYEELQKANEQLKILDQARAEFITIASHQLRTPPATVKWYLSAILAGDYGKLPADAYEQIKKTAQTNNHLISLIEDMLNVSRIERGKMEFLFQLTDVEELALLAYEQLIPMAADKKLKLTYQKPKTALPKIMADKEKLKQVMNNLIDNALKYSKTGTVLVSLEKKGGEIVFIVKDSGKGISPEDRELIFQKYSRGKESVKQSAGLGLGLYVAKIIIDQHKGKIWAESEGEGKGSSFMFSLPINNGLKETTLVDLAAEEGKNK